jgi:predicted enzyme related to lactoylglutathione lyase
MSESAWKPPPHGGPCWLQINVTDIPRAKKFYETVFNWTFQPPTEAYPESVIAMFQVPGGSLNGGLTSRPGGRGTIGPGGVLLYLLVADVDEALKNIVAAGGKVVTPTEPEGAHGMMATFADTEGNVSGVYHAVM